jgi:hypothetical protein
MPYVNPTWTLNALNGTRKSYETPFFDTAPQVLYDDGLRPDLGLGAAVQQWRLIWEFTNTSEYNNPNFYEGLAFWVSLPLLDSQWPLGLTSVTAAAGPGAANVGGTTSTSGTSAGSAPVLSVTPADPATSTRTASGAGSTPVVSVTPADPTMSTLAGRGLAVTVSRIPPGTTVSVSVSAPAQTQGAIGTAKSNNTPAKRAKGTQLGAATGKAGKTRRAKVRVRTDRPGALARHKSMKAVSVRTTITSSKHRHRVVITRVVRLKSAAHSR